MKPLNRVQWRNWLKANHASQKEIWLVLLKKHTGRQAMSYEDAVEEAICFGWIDGILKRIDENTFRRRFTPRAGKSHWSEPNLRRARRMIDAGRMTPAGLEKLGDALMLFERHGSPQKHPLAVEAPPELMARLQTHGAAWREFRKLPPSLRQQYIGWVTDARKETTRLRRLQEVIAVLARGERLGLK